MSDSAVRAPRPNPEDPTPAIGDLLPDDIGVRAHSLVEVDLTAAIPVPEDLGLIGSDLDGTLLGPDLTIGARSLAAIPALAAVGVGFVYVTGRPPRWLRPIIAQTGHAHMAVCANGALVIDLAQERLVRHTTIDPDLAAAVALRLRELVPGVSFALERLVEGAPAARNLDDLTVVGFEPIYDPPWARMPGVESADILDLIRRGEPVKILAAPPAGTGHDSDSLLALAEAEFAGALHITHSGTRDVIIEIMSGEIDKGIGFLEVADAMGVAGGRTAAIGDMPNDVALLRAAGTAYAMANAHPAARAVADHLLPSNAADGVGRLLEAIVAERTPGP